MSGISTGTALAIGLGTAGAVTTGVLGYEGQQGQAQASESAAQLQAQEAQNALNFQENQWSTTQQNQEPFLKAGQSAVSDLSGLLAPGGSLTQAYPGGQFTAPTAAQAEQTPGYQFTLQQGLNALNNSAAAQGNLLSGGQLAAQQQYGQGLASNTYQQSYNNALNSYNTNYNTWQQQQANQFNRLASVAGLGQTTAGQLGQQGQQAASNAGNIDVNLGSQLGQDYLNAASSRASGYNAIGNSVNNLGQYAALASIGGLGAQGAGVDPYGNQPINPGGSYDPATGVYN